MREASVLANVAASVVVGEVGTSPITAGKLLHAAEMRLRDRETGEGTRPCG
jgi:bifunctional ADP-heptose synthase (sugar kinase/adenylyltransferase)